MESNDLFGVVVSVISCFLGLIFVGGLSFLFYYFSNKHKLDFTFEVGEKEKHTIRFFYESFWGRVKIYVDGVQKFSTIKLINGDVVYNLVVGTQEVQNLQFQIKMPFFYGAFRQRSCEVSCNGKLIKTVLSGNNIS